MKKKKIVIVGATSAIAHHCARIWASGANVELILIGRDEVGLDRVAADLTARASDQLVGVTTLVTDFVNPESIKQVVDQVNLSGPTDVALIAHGSLTDQAEAQVDLGYCESQLIVNAISPVLFAEACASHMAISDRGTLAVIGSVAGDRGRKSNYVYGSAKGLVNRYVQGLQHRFAGTNVRVVLIKPGPTDTPMTAHFKAKGVKLASVDEVAWSICKAIERKVSVAYVPSKWRLIMLIIQHLPSAIFNKLNI